MPKPEHSLNPEQLQLLKQFKQQLTQPKPKAKVAAKQPIYTAPNSSAQTDDERALLQKAMQGVQPLKDSNLAPIAQTKAKRTIDAQTLAKRLAAEGAEQLDNVMLSDMHALLNPVASEAFLSYKTTTLPNRIFDELKAGKLRWFEAVDLHGSTVEQAREAVLELLRLAKADNQTVVKVVHGKGKDAVLKTCVNGWLRQHQEVLAFVSAPERQGGTGAVLVLLKRAEKAPPPPNR